MSLTSDLQQHATLYTLGTLALAAVVAAHLAFARGRWTFATVHGPTIGPGAYRTAKSVAVVRQWLRPRVLEVVSSLLLAAWGLATFCFALAGLYTFIGWPVCISGFGLAPVLLTAASRSLRHHDALAGMTPWLRVWSNLHHLAVFGTFSLAGLVSGSPDWIAAIAVPCLAGWGVMELFVWAHREPQAQA